MIISIADAYGCDQRWIIISPDTDWYHARHLYVTKTWRFETLGM